MISRDDDVTMTEEETGTGTHQEETEIIPGKTRTVERIPHPCGEILNLIQLEKAENWKERTLG